MEKKAEKKGEMKKAEKKPATKEARKEPEKKAEEKKWRLPEIHQGAGSPEPGARGVLALRLVPARRVRERPLGRPPFREPLEAEGLDVHGLGPSVQDQLRQAHSHRGRDLEPRAAERRRQIEPVHRSEEHTSELQSLAYLVCRLLLEKKKNIKKQ